MTSTGHISLSQLQAHIKDALAASFRAPVWIVAEIADLKVNYSSGHCYMELVEKGSANGVPKAQARAVVWRNTYGMLSEYFKGATGQALSAGMKVLVSVTVAYHELYGLSLQVCDIDPLYTVGDMERQRQETIAQLKEDGVFDLNRELEIPLAAQRIAVISSPGAAGFRDFMNELQGYAYRFDVELFEAVMQGHGAEDSIIGALGRIAGREEDFDVMVMIRGGGSQSDLGFLNSYLLSCHIAQFPLPVITGLGHDKDRSVIDMVAALPLKTPTAAAGYLVQLAADLDAVLGSMDERLALRTGQYLQEQRRHVGSLAESLARRSRGMTHMLELRLARSGGELSRLASRYFISAENRLSALSSLLAERTRYVLKGSSGRLDDVSRIIDARDPKAILSMGFAIVRSEGKILRNSAQAAAGSEIDITLHEGNIKAKITDNGKGN